MGTPYHVYVRAFNADGRGAPSLAQPAPLAPLEAPSAPRDALIFALAPTSLKVSWQAPQSSGGASIARYRVEWDVDADFSNLATSGYFAEVDGQTLCYAIAISAASSTVPRFARVSAYNGFDWSPPAGTTPPSAAGQLLPPGPSLDAGLEVTSGVGLLVTWTPPSSELTCEYGGDGGGAIGEYAVEWDESPLFDSPASRALVPASALVSLGGGVVGFEIGGRDPMTGVESTLLVEGATYYVRVTAFNAQGAGPAVATTPPYATTADAVASALSSRVLSRTRSSPSGRRRCATAASRSRSSWSRTTRTRASRRPRSRARPSSRRCRASCSTRP